MDCVPKGKGNGAEGKVNRLCKVTFPKLSPIGHPLSEC